MLLLAHRRQTFSRAGLYIMEFPQAGLRFLRKEEQACLFAPHLQTQGLLPI
jgi:hypothetical protein